MKRLLHSRTTKTFVGPSVRVRLCCLLLLCLAGGGLDAQTRNMVTLNLVSRPIQKAIESIEQQTDYRFLYNGRLIDVSKKITVHVENQPIVVALKKVFAGTGIEYKIQNRQIILTLADSAKQESASLKRTVRGIVRDQKTKEPLVGVTVLLEGTSAGTTTGIDGRYSIECPEVDAQSTLQFSFLGYSILRERINNRRVVDVELSEEAREIDDVVVVAYGVQRKANLSGAVSSVNLSEAAETRAITNLSAGLQGLSSGLLAQQSSGQPGSDGASITIRGLGTLNNSSPLVIVDGIVGNMADVNPNDVASISVLKDAASSAIYGSRAANGVLLITTKTGSSERIRVTYNGKVGIQQVNIPIDVVSDYVTYMKTINQATRNAGNVAPFSDEIIEEWSANSALDPIVYPNTNWFDAVYKNAVIHEHNVQASGGSEKVNYMVSFGFLQNNGTMKKSDYTKYSFRSNISAEVTKWLRVNAGINGYHGIQQGVDISSLMGYLSNSSPGTLPQHPDGRFGGEWAPGGNVQSNNIYANLASSDQTNYYTRLNGKLGLDFTLAKNVKWYNSFAVNSGFGYSSIMNYPNINIWDFKNNAVLITTGTTSIQLTEDNTRAYSLIFDSHLHYDILPSVKNHNLSLILGYNQEYNQSRNSYINALDVLSTDTPVLNAASTPSKITGTYTDNAIRSFFGRVNYDFKGKYIFEANFRADGSSRFAKGNRWGYFPSFSGAWRISEEPFMKGVEHLDNLKIRVSWGQLGNNSVSDYATQLLYKRKSYVFGSSVATGAGISAVVNDDLRWETTTMTNLGVDVNAFRSRLSVTADVFDKLTTDILVQTTIPGVLGGLSAPYRNAGKVRNRGFELELGWKDRIGEFSYGVSGNYSYVKNKVLKYQGDVASYSSQKILLERYGIYDYYVREVECIATQEKIDQMLADGYVFYPSTPHPGDFIYKDQQKPGEEGYKVIDDNDRVIKGSSYPSHFFGFNLSMEWKGIDFSALFSGVAGISCYLNGTWYTNVLKNGSIINSKFLNAWSLDNQSSNIPALTTDDGGRNTVANDFWLQNASYLKLRNLTLGYTLPQKWTNKFFVSRMRVYFTGENLLTFTSFDGLDPETGSAYNYPNMRRFMFGVSVTFR